MKKHGWLLLVLSLAALLPLASIADDDDDDDEHERHGRRSARMGPGPRQTPEWATYEEECGSCHLAYPPGFLPRRSWDALMGGLENHFGQNAELDAPTQEKLGPWLSTWAAESGSDRRSFKFIASAAGWTPLRITETRYWRHKHDEVPNATFARKSVGSRANCPACHQGADKGDFDEDTVKIPKDAPAPR